MEPKVGKSRLASMLRIVNDKATKWKLADCRKSDDANLCLKMKEYISRYERSHSNLKDQVEDCMSIIDTEPVSPHLVEEYYECVKGVEKSYKELTKHYFYLLNE